MMSSANWIHHQFTTARRSHHRLLCPPSPAFAAANRPESKEVLLAPTLLPLLYTKIESVCQAP
jgi:hypothetical protein